MPNAQFRVRVTKDHLVFSAAHFITFNRNVCERLHGHNWRTAVEVRGPLDENRYVFDFIALRNSLQSIVNELDHRVLLPSTHSDIRVEVGEKEVAAYFEDRRWVFPREDCVVLPVANTTAELIADWIASKLIDVITKHVSGGAIETVQVEVEENFGQWAICERSLGDGAANS